MYPHVSSGADPERYGSLHHPGDPYAFDIFNQALQAIKYPTAPAPLGDLAPTMVLVEGFQPSIDKWFPTGAPDPGKFTGPFGINGPLNAYLANGADDDARLADGFLIDAAAPPPSQVTTGSPRFTTSTSRPSAASRHPQDEPRHVGSRRSTTR